MMQMNFSVQKLFKINLFKIFLFKISILLFVTACSTKFIVVSDPPQAEVFIMDLKSGEKKTIGKTPIEMPVEDVKKSLTNKPTAGEFYTIVVEKPGFDAQTFSIPAGQFTTLVTSLDVKMKEGKSVKELKIAKEILDHLFLAQRFAVTGQFERSHIELDKIIVQFPSFARAYSMRASVFYAQKNYPESLKWYEEAIKLDPDLEEAVKMTAKIRSLLNLPTAANPSVNPNATVNTTLNPTTNTVNNSNLPSRSVSSQSQTQAQPPAPVKVKK